MEHDGSSSEDLRLAGLETENLELRKLRQWGLAFAEIGPQPGQENFGERSSSQGNYGLVVR